MNVGPKVDPETEGGNWEKTRGEKNRCRSKRWAEKKRDKGKASNKRGHDRFSATGDS